MHKIIDSGKADELRAAFTKSFVDTSTDYYKALEKVKTADIVHDYVHRYLRDTLYRGSTDVIPFRSAIETIREKNHVYSMWDIRPEKVICASDPDHDPLKPHYLELYKSDTVIEWDADELAALLETELGDYNGAGYVNSTLPEDIYIFDSSFEWSVIFTHSEIDGERLCYICKRKLTDAELVRKWLNAFGSNVDKTIIKERVTSAHNYLWHLFTWRNVSCYKGDAARDAFNALRYSEAIKFCDGCGCSIENVSAVGKVTAKDIDEDAGRDVYLVGKDFSWTYVRTHEADLGPYLCVKK